MFVNLCFVSKVSEIGRISVVMYVSDHFICGKLQLTLNGVSLSAFRLISLVSMWLIQLTLPASFSSKFGFLFAKILGLG